MTELAETEATPVTKVARNLTAIVDLAASLEDQAIAKANDRLMPGGLAMVALADVANLDAWAELLEAAEHRHLTDPNRWAETVVDDEDDWEPPLQSLRFWSDTWRTHHGMSYGQKTTLAGEANFLRWALNWAWDNEPRWDTFAGDIRDTRLRLESLLYAGSRAERSRVVCDRETCETHPRLIKVYTDTPTDDHHKCPACKARFNTDEFGRAFAKQLRSTGAEKFVVLPDAIGTLTGLGRSERTIRKWLAPPLQHEADRCEECGLTWEPDEYASCPAETPDEEPCGGFLEAVWSGDSNAVIQSYCEVGTHRVWVWWPDLWHLHLRTQTRVRAVA